MGVARAARILPICFGPYAPSGVLNFPGATRPDEHNEHNEHLCYVMDQLRGRIKRRCARIKRSPARCARRCNGHTRKQKNTAGSVRTETNRQDACYACYTHSAHELTQPLSVIVTTDIVATCEKLTDFMLGATDVLRDDAVRESLTSMHPPSRA